MNIKELKEAIKDLPDDMLVYTTYWESNDNGTSWEIEEEANYCNESFVTMTNDKYPYLDKTKSGKLRKVGKYSNKLSGKVFIIH